MTSASHLDPSRAISSRIPVLLSIGIALAGAVLLQRWRRGALSVPRLFRRQGSAGQGVASHLLRQVGLPLLTLAANQIGQRVLHRVLAKLGPLELETPPHERPALVQHAPAAE